MSAEKINLIGKKCFYKPNYTHAGLGNQEIGILHKHFMGADGVYTGIIYYPQNEGMDKKIIYHSFPFKDIVITN